MKTVAAILSVIVILSIAAWAQTPASGPAASQPTTSPRESEPVQQNGVDFQVVTQRVWVLDGGTPVPLALKITNRTDKALQFNHYDAVIVHIKDAAGKELEMSRWRRAIATGKPLLVETDQSGTIAPTATLKRTDRGFGLHGSDGAGGGWLIDGFKAGTYSISIAYANTQEAADRLKKTIPVGDDPFWIGKVTTKELTVEVVEKPVATTQPASP